MSRAASQSVEVDGYGGSGSGADRSTIRPQMKVIGFPYCIHKQGVDADAIVVHRTARGIHHHLRGSGAVDHVVIDTARTYGSLVASDREPLGLIKDVIPDDQVRLPPPQHDLAG